MTHVKELVEAAVLKVQRKYWFNVARTEAKACRHWWQMYQDRPNMFFREEWHIHLLRWDEAMGYYNGLATN